MKKYISLFLLGAGWILFILFLVSGNYYKKFSNSIKPSLFTPIPWENHIEIFKGAIYCSLTSEKLAERKKELKDKIFAKIIKKVEIQNGFLYYFEDDPILLNDVFHYIKEEKDCCPFFKFDISILPFEKGFAMQISGSEEAFKFLKDFEDNEM